MSVKEIHDFLLYSLVINYLILLIWFGFFVKAHDLIYRLHSRWFKFSMQTFDTIHYSGLAIYKIGIILLNLVPLLALCIVY
jgi:hypothetical protein